MFTKAERSTFPYWFAHWAAFQMTALNLRAWRFKYLFHDIEKPWLRIFLPYTKVQELHRTYNRHHPEWLENKLSAYEDELYYSKEIIDKYLDRFDYEGAIIDWECCHFTKVECPLDAYGEFKRLTKYFSFKEKYPLITNYCYEEFCNRLLETIKNLGLYHDEQNADNN